MLRKITEKRLFENESSLEEFIWANLENLLNLAPLKRQYPFRHHGSGERCDILALDESNHPVVLELKNVENKCIVQQLTRYYDYLLDDIVYNELQVYCDECSIKLEYPIKLIAIAPSFHQYSFLELKYHELRRQFQLLRYKRIQCDEGFYLRLINEDSGETSQVKIPYS